MDETVKTEEKSSKTLDIDDDAWRLGYYQSTPYPSDPSKFWPEAGFREFLLPEKKLSLKLLFDNFRNYGICAAFAAFGIFVLRNKAGLAGHEYLPTWFATFSATGALAIAVTLLLLNVIQSGMIFLALCDAYYKARAMKTHIMRGRNKFEIILAVATIIYMFLEAAVLAILTIVLPIAMLAVLLGFVWFGATSKVL